MPLLTPLFSRDAYLTQEFGNLTKGQTITSHIDYCAYYPLFCHRLDAPTAYDTFTVVDIARSSLLLTPAKRDSKAEQSSPDTILGAQKHARNLRQRSPFHYFRSLTRASSRSKKVLDDTFSSIVFVLFSPLPRSGQATQKILTL